MTARKLPPAGRPLRSFFILGTLQPPPTKGDLREVPLRGRDKLLVPEENGEGVSFAGGQPAPAGDWGTALPGWACSRGA